MQGIPVKDKLHPKGIRIVGVIPEVRPQHAA